MTCTKSNNLFLICQSGEVRKYFSKSSDSAYAESKRQMASLETQRTGMPGEFVFFSSLPTEIRLRIWFYALPGPRIVDIHYNPAIDMFVELSNPAGKPLAHVNMEARKVMLKNYSAHFSTALQNPLIYVDTKIDVIKLNFDAFRHRKITGNEYAIIRYLEISDAEIHEIDATQLIIQLGLMPNLKQLLVVDPRSPFISRHFPSAPAILNAETLWRYNVSRGEFFHGLELERRSAVVWDRLVEIDNAARRSLYGLANFTTGMVGVTASGERRYRMVHSVNHN